MTRAQSWRMVLCGAAVAGLGASMTGQSPGIDQPILFVSRQIPQEGSIYWDKAKGLPGVGPYSRLQVAAPGRLRVREPNGTIRTLVDGGAPTAASLQLVDVSSADVSYDGQRIVFAGLPAGSYSRLPAGNPNAWRLYVINVDGSGLRQITFTEPGRDTLPTGLRSVDDFDPAWLPDGRIVFASTRWPSYGHYGGVRTSNLYVVGADGSQLHRITAERNGADRPVVDPQTGQIVFARWWRNHRFALDSFDTKTGGGGYDWKDGLSAVRGVQMDGTAAYADLLWRNAWHVATIRPDGTELKMWGGATGQIVDDDRNHAYGGAFAANGGFYANYFPMSNMTEAAGFGGIRFYPRGPQGYVPVTGITGLTLNYVRRNKPTSFGIFVGSYATDPVPLPDGRMLMSWAADTGQNYGLYVANADGSSRVKVYDVTSTTELRATLVMPRPLPPVLIDTVPTAAALRPPAATTPAGPFDGDGTFVYDALNVYFNAPVDTNIVHAPAVGSAATIRFFIDHQRASQGSFPPLDWPILVKELNVDPSGAVRDSAAPANVPLFEQLRSLEGRVPFTGAAANPTGAAHVAGLNYGRPGGVARCVGCHAGHTMIQVPENLADAAWSNLAPGAAVTVSSTRAGADAGGLVDRLVQHGELEQYWSSADGRQDRQWALLTFPVPIQVRTVRLYNPRSGAEPEPSLQVLAATVRLFADPGGSREIAMRRVGRLSEDGTDVPFADVPARAVRVELDKVQGTFLGATVASLAEIEVIASGAATPPTSRVTRTTHERN
jgi:hypothetical protein